MNNDSGWQSLYESAMLELDHEQLRKKIEIADAAIKDRMLALKGDGKSSSEQLAMADALQNLRTLQRVELGKTAPNTLQPCQEGAL